MTVQDNGSPSLSSTTRVVVTVADLNDEEPQFMERMYRVRIPERAATAEMHSLYRVLAHDRDMGANADIDYSIKSGRGNGRFRINAKTGMILSDKDFVADSQYDLTVSIQRTICVVSSLLWMIRWTLPQPLHVNLVNQLRHKNLENPHHDEDKF